MLNLRVYRGMILQSTCSIIFPLSYYLLISVVTLRAANKRVHIFGNRVCFVCLQTQMSEELVKQLSSYKAQLQQVEVALSTDPDNEDLLKLQKDLQVRVWGPLYCMEYIW